MDVAESGRFCFARFPPRPFRIGHIRNNLCFTRRRVSGSPLCGRGIYTLHGGNQRTAAVIYLPRWPLWVAWEAAAVGKFLGLRHLFAVKHGMRVACTRVQRSQPFFFELNAHLLRRRVAVHASCVLRTGHSCTGSADGGIAAHGGNALLQVIRHVLDALALQDGACDTLGNLLFAILEVNTTL